MEFEKQQQLFDTLGKSEKILIALPSHPNGDTLGSSLALSAFLKKMNKDVEIYCSNSDFGKFSFLPNIGDIKNEMVFPKNFVVKVSTANTKVDEVSYHHENDQLKIFIKPKSGEFTPEDVSYGSEASPYDLIVCLDTPSLEQLGPLFEKNAEVFFATPKVNIDNHIRNENYANINIVDVTAASTSEILLELLKQYESNLIDESIATCLLTGIISETNSFQHNSTTPSTFLRASELVALGANQQEIIRFLFKTKELPVLKLWGRAMARIKNVPEIGLVYSMVSAQDMEKSQASSEDLEKVLAELVVNVADARLLILVAERQGFLEMYIHAHPNVKIAEIVNHFGGQLLSATLGKAVLEGVPIVQAETVILETVNKLKQRLGLL